MHAVDYLPSLILGGGTEKKRGQSNNTTPPGGEGGLTPWYRYNFTPNRPLATVFRRKGKAHARRERHAVPRVGEARTWRTGASTWRGRGMVTTEGVRVRGASPWLGLRVEKVRRGGWPGSTVQLNMRVQMTLAACLASKRRNSLTH